MSHCPHLKRAVMGDIGSCAKVSDYFYRGTGNSVKDLDEAIRWGTAAVFSDVQYLPKLIKLLKMRNHANDAEFIKFLLHYFSKKGEIVADYLLACSMPSLDETISALRSISNSGYVPATVDLINCLIERNDDADVSEAFQLLELVLKSEQLNNNTRDELLYKIIKMLVLGIGTTISYDRAFELVGLIADGHLKLLLLHDLYVIKNDISGAKEVLLQLNGNSDDVVFRKMLWNLEKREFERKYKPEEIVNIMILSSNEYARYAAVLIKSATVNISRPLHFFIVTHGMRDTNKQYLIDSLDSKSSIDFIELNPSFFDCINYPNATINSHRWTKLTLCRIIPHLLLPESVHKVLSLGADTIIDGDISDYYDSDMSDLCILGTASIEDMRRYMQDPTCDTITRVNGDVLLLNLDRIRSHNIQLEDYISFIPQVTALTEEQLLPIMFKKEIEVVDTSRFNFRLTQTHRRYANQKVITPRPAIIQYFSYKKPWFMYSDSDFIKSPLFTYMDLTYEENNHFKTWWKYAKMCKHYEDLLSNLKIIRVSIAFNAMYSHSQSNDSS